MRHLIWVVLPASLITSGCIPPGWLFDDDDDEVPLLAPPADPGPAPADDAAPTLDIEIADWPPIGRDTGVSVTASSQSGLARVELDFLYHATVLTTGTAATVFVTGQELGEGYGRLAVGAFDVRGAFTEGWVDNLLVDLSPPEVTLGQVLLPAAPGMPESQLELFVADAWVLGRVELQVGSVVLVHDFEDGYPPSIGTEWDTSLVLFPASALPLGANTAEIRAYDAAGNVATQPFELILDADPPVATIQSPAAGASLSGAFTIQLVATDPGDGPVWVDLSLGGTPLGSVPGPYVDLSVDTAELTPGPSTLVAVPVDAAGNRGAEIVVPVTIL